MSPPDEDGMKQTTFRCGTDVPCPNDNISVPFGLIGTVEHYLQRTGVLDLLDTFKERGVPLRRIAVAMCTHILMGNNSMAKCSDWLSDPFVLKELGFGKNVSQRTINRAMNIIGDHADEVLVQLWKGMNSFLHLTDTDVNMDGSAVVFNGPNSELGDFGYPRDFKDQSRPQVAFMTAELSHSKIPFFIRAYSGRVPDVTQYRDSLPPIFDMIRQGSWIVMDNGGASGDILDSIVGAGNKYLTRVKMNRSDVNRMTEHKDGWQYVEDGVCCLTHTFGHSGRTTYLFYSVDNWLRSYRAAERRFGKMVDTVNKFREGKVCKSDYVTIRNNIFATVDVSISVQDRLYDFTDTEKDELIRGSMPAFSGFFKLESSEQLTPCEALDKYRARATVEHLIHSLKRVSGIKPLRVWKESSIRGSMLLALLSETTMAIARYRMEPRKHIKDSGGRRIEQDSRPSTESVVWSLSHLTICRVIENKVRKKAVFSNWDGISREVFARIRADAYG